MSAQQQSAIQSILEGRVAGGGAVPFKYGSFSQVSGLEISLAPDPFGSSDITIAQANFFGGSNLGTARVADFPELDQRISGGDVWFGDDYASYRTPVLGTYSWLTHIHEFGHSVGLAHGHNQGTNTPGFGAALPQDRDSMEFSVMTYRSYLGDPLWGGYSNEEFGYAQTLMMLDIAALQHLYGANFSTNSGNTVYTWSATTGQMSVNGAGQGAPGGNRLFLTVWDGGGTDTYDFSNYGSKAFIDLAPGGWSLVSDVQRAYLGEGAYANGNVYNALQYKDSVRSLIENAKGGAGNDEIAGNQAQNTLWGNNGNDVLIGRGGNDTLHGGNGNDTLYGDFRTPATTYGGSGLFTEPAGAANSTRATAINLDSYIGMRTDANIQGSATDPSVKVTGTGNAAFDWYSFNVRAPGKITLDIDGNIDSYIELYDSTGKRLAFNDDSNPDPGDAPIGHANRSYQSFIAHTLTAPGRYFVKVATFGDNVLANGLAYTLNIVVPNPVETGSGGGNDTLYGGAGNDALFGGAGNDLLIGGAGADKLIGGAGFDTASYEGATRGVTASLARPASNTNDARGDTYSSVEHLTGTNYADTLIGNSGANTLTGGNGKDVLIGGAGADKLVGGAGSDTASYEGAARGVTASLAKPASNTNDARGDTYSSIENLTGTKHADKLIGNNGANTLNGGGGNDTLIGGAGGDRLVGGAGVDTASYEGAKRGVTASLAKPSVNTNDAKGDVYSAIENLTGSSHADKLIGNNGANVLNGGAGNDRLEGGAGHDTLIGGAGKDILVGGTGRDVLTGGAGADIFLFDTAPAIGNVDRIVDFNVKDDTIHLENSIFTALAKGGTLLASMFLSNTTGKAEDVDDHIIYRKSTGELFYDSNGSASGGSVLIAELAKNLSLTHNDFFVV